MQRNRVRELFFIAPVEYVPSILTEGILAHNKVPHLHEHSIANPSVQGERADKRIPGRGPLHDFANVYFNGRNPMLYGVLGCPNTAMTGLPHLDCQVEINRYLFFNDGVRSHD